MKTIKIFLASSEELKDERNTMADLILHLNKLFRGRGLELDLEKWEYLDASMTGKRKQDEYNEVLKQCDICMVLFWRKFGSFTGEELDTAYNRMKQNEKPHKIYVFFKNPNSDELTQELKDFIANYEQRFGGHFFCKFQNVDTMKLEFLLQLENYQKDLIGEKTIEVRNEHVYVDNEAMVDLNNIPFAAQNEGFREMQAKLANLRDNIEKKRHELDEKKIALERTKSELSKLPNMDSFLSIINMAQKTVDDAENELQQYIDSKNKLEEDFDREQQNLFNTARRITEQRGLMISQRMARAIEAFELGDAKRADIILDEAEKDADQALTDIRIAKQVGLKSLEELILKTSTKMSNDSIPIDVRIEDTIKIYEKAERLARELDYDDKKYVKLLFNKAEFLKKHAFHENALIIYEQVISLIKRYYGENWRGLIPIYNAIGELFYNQSKYEEEKDWHYKALNLAKEHYGNQNVETAQSYNDLGIALGHLGDLKGSLDCIQTAYDIRIKLLGENHLDTAESYNNLGCYYSEMAEFNRAIDYYKKSLVIRQRISGSNSLLVAQSYNNIGHAYYQLGDYFQAREHILKAKNVIVSNLGIRHPEYAGNCNMLALIAHVEEKFDESLNLYMESLRIKERIFGKESIPYALVCGNIGCLYFDMGEMGKAGHYQGIATRTYEKLLGADHPDTALQYDNLGYIYGEFGDFEKSAEYYRKALNVYEKVYGSEHSDTKRVKEALGLVS